jgi:hypothetical protein
MLLECTDGRPHTIFSINKRFDLDMSLPHTLNVPSLCIKLTNHISLFTKSLKGNTSDIGVERLGNVTLMDKNRQEVQTGTEAYPTIIKVVPEALSPWLKQSRL